MTTGHHNRQPLPPQQVHPPSYVVVPVALAYAGVGAGSAQVEDGLLVTMIRILGLCWAHDGRRTPALSIAHLAAYVGRPRRTLTRHLRILENDLGWLHVERTGHQLILRPSLPATPVSDRQTGPSPNQQGTSPPPSPPPPDPDLLAALDDVGIENPARDHLARRPGLDPAWVRAWHLWSRHPSRGQVRNPAGLLVRKLSRGEPPPAEYLRLVALTPRQQAALRQAYWDGGGDLDDSLRDLLPLFRMLSAEHRQDRG